MLGLAGFHIEVTILNVPAKTLHNQMFSKLREKADIILREEDKNIWEALGRIWSKKYWGQ